MNDEPIDSDPEQTLRLTKIAPLFKKGWAKLHPMTEQHRALIKNAFQEAHQARQEASQSPEIETVAPKVSRRQTKAQKPSEQSQTKRQGPHHSH